MTSQVIFKIDKKIKDRAMKKAQNDGIAFASVLKLATEAYAKGDLDVELIAQPRLNLKTQREIRQAQKDFKMGRNISPTFDNAKDAMRWLKQAAKDENSI